MTLMEFSIACKLINLKLRGFEVPKQIPPTLLCSLTTAGGTPIMTPPGQMSPLIFNRPLMAQPQLPPMVPVQPQHPPPVPAPPVLPPQPLQSLISPISAPTPLVAHPIVPPAIPPQPMIPPQPHHLPPAIPPQPQHIPAQPVAIAPTLTSPVQAPPPNLLSQPRKPSGGNLLDSLDNTNDISLLTNGAAPKPPSQPGTRSGSISDGPGTAIPYEAKCVTNHSGL